MTHKKCKACGFTKEVTQFSIKRRDRADPYQPKCKVCTRLAATNKRRTLEGKIIDIYNDQKRNSKNRGHDLPTYSSKELLLWALDNNYADLYTAWVDSLYNTNLAPSVDRLDDKKPYSLDNIRLVTWETNRSQLHTDRLNGKNTSLSKTVKQYSGSKLLATFPSTREAARVTGVQQNSISKCARGLQHRAGGYRWEYS